MNWAYVLHTRRMDLIPNHSNKLLELSMVPRTPPLPQNLRCIAKEINKSLFHEMGSIKSISSFLAILFSEGHMIGSVYSTKWIGIERRLWFHLHIFCSFLLQLYFFHTLVLCYKGHPFPYLDKAFSHFSLPSRIGRFFRFISDFLKHHHFMI